MAKTGRPAVHGESVHGSRTTEWRTWSSMRDRCLNKKHKYYADYGGRGITIHPEWNSYPVFLDYLLTTIGRRPAGRLSLDRIDNSIGYVPGNIRWATITEQHNNKRNNVIIEFNGERLSKAAMARRHGMSRFLLQKRLDAGWTIEKALTTPSIGKPRSR